MKEYFTLIFCLFCLFLQATPPNQMQFSEARSRAAAEGKLHVVYFSATWCAPCQVMKEYTWPAQNVQEYCTENCLLTFMDIDEPNGSEFGAKYGVGNIPTIIVFNSKGENVGRIENSLPGELLIDFIDRFNTPNNRTVVLDSGTEVENPKFLATPNTANPQLKPKPSTTPYLSQAHTVRPVAVQEPIAVQGNDWNIHGPSTSSASSIAPLFGSPIEPASSSSSAGQNLLAAAEPTSASQPITYAKPNRIVAAPQRISGTRFTVQVGAFRNLENAVSAQKQFIQKYGLDSTVEMPRDGVNGIYRVTIGEFGDRSLADELDRAMQVGGFVEAFVRTK